MWLEKNICNKCPDLFFLNCWHIKQQFPGINANYGYNFLHKGGWVLKIKWVAAGGRESAGPLDAAGAEGVKRQHPLPTYPEGPASRSQCPGRDPG